MPQNPITFTLSKGVWTKIIASERTGQIHRLPTADGDRYLITHRLPGQAAPTDTSDAIYLEDQSTEFEFDGSVDIYMMAVDSNGKVRVDI